MRYHNARYHFSPTLPSSSRYQLLTMLGIVNNAAKQTMQDHHEESIGLVVNTGLSSENWK